jgi:hypothetical protein
VTFSYTPQNPTDTCNQIYTKIPAVFSIGGMNLPGGNVSRSEWDANRFYFSLANIASSADPNCGHQQNGVPCSDSFQFLSSSPELYFSQGWTANAQKNGDGYDISSNLSTTKVNRDNRYRFYQPACSNYPQGETIEASEAVDILVLSKRDGVGMTGNVSPTTATATITVSDRWDGDTYLNATLTVKFTGTWFTSGAKLDNSGPYPATSGKSTFVAPPPSSGDSTSNSISKYLKIIVPAVSAAAVLGLILCCGLKCIKGSRARKAASPAGNYEAYAHQGFPMQQPYEQKQPTMYTETQAVYTYPQGAFRPAPHGL